MSFGVVFRVEYIHAARTKAYAHNGTYTEYNGYLVPIFLFVAFYRCKNLGKHNILDGMEHVYCISGTRLFQALLND